MKYVTFTWNSRPTWGVLEGEEVVDVGSVLASRFPDLRSLCGQEVVDQVAAAFAKAPRAPVADIQWAPVIPNPSKILCVGHNYESHRKETARAKVANPSIFTRFADTQVGHLQPIVRPLESTCLDFEGELAIVIGRGGRRIPAADAMNHIAGYTCYNEASIRDWQWHTTQFAPGKNFPNTGACGPWLVTPDEIGDVTELTLTTRLNGEVVQQALVGEMLFDIPTIIAYVSGFTALSPGDIICTGTPGGVGGKREPPLWMKPGDVVEVEISRVGILRNSIVAEV